jgi:hypothetical protein
LRLGLGGKAIIAKGGIDHLLERNASDESLKS